jgi:hypothetical protein
MLGGRDSSPTNHNDLRLHFDPGATIAGVHEPTLHPGRLLDDREYPRKRLALLDDEPVLLVEELAQAGQQAKGGHIDAEAVGAWAILVAALPAAVVVLVTAGA